MDRIEKTEMTMQDLGVEDEVLTSDFPEFAEVKDRFIYGETWHQAPLDGRHRFLVSIASLATVEGDDLFGMLRAALRFGIEPPVLQEIFHQVAPYIGFAKAEKGLSVLRQAFAEGGVPLPLAPQATVIEENRLERGIEAQKSIFGPMIDAMRAAAPADQMFMQDALSACCFGDTYTRGALDLPTRELLTFVAIISLGGCDSQAKSHAGGNLAVGNGPDVLAAAVQLCIPYIGFPRSLNAMSAIGEVLQAQSKRGE